MGRKKHSEDSRADSAASGDAVEGRALADFVHDGKPVKTGDVFTADEATMAGYVAAGQADTHPDAVAYAKETAKG